MNLLSHSFPRYRISLHTARPSYSSSPRCSSSTATRCGLPFPREKAEYYRELEAAIDAVQKACRLCVDVRTQVKKSLFSGHGQILEKNDQTPVTIADFGVQALISLELSRSFPSIPLVAEEDSTFLRSNSGSSNGEEGYVNNFLVDSVLNAVTDKASTGDKPLTDQDVLEAIDRGGKDAFSFGKEPAAYWVLDPIDGTRGFLKGREALYVCRSFDERLHDHKQGSEILDQASVATNMAEEGTKKGMTEKREGSPPEKPLPGDCCSSGCVRCVWDIYFEELAEYNNCLSKKKLPSQNDGDSKPKSCSS